MERYKLLMFIPAILLIFSAVVLYDNYIKTGSFMERDIELTGGLTITLQTHQNIAAEDLEKLLPGSTIRIAKGYDNNLVIIQTKDLDDQYILSKLSSIDYDKNSVEIGKVEPAIGDIFWQQAQTAMIAAFVLMGIVVFIMFRAPVPSIMMISCVIIDIMMTAAAISLLEIKLSMAVFASLLLLIGYSIDTDMLLTTRVLRGQDSMEENIKASIKTGLTMTSTGVAAVFCMWIFSQGTILHDMGIVLMVGLCFDMLNTWITNVGLLRIWLGKKNGA